MFTNLDFLNIGKKWVPNNTVYAERQKNYNDGRLLYDGKFVEVFEDVWQAMASRYGADWQEIQQVLININLFRTLTETFKTLAFSKEPEITDEKGEKLDNKIFNCNSFYSTMKKAFISAHAQGDGVFKVYTKSNGEIGISSVNPELWIPVYNPNNLDEIEYHVVGYVYEVENDTYGWVNGSYIQLSDKYLDIEVHHKGGYEKRLYKLDKFNIIKKRLTDPATEFVKFTNWNDFAVFPFNYGTPSWRTFGMSQYADIIPLIDELVVRISNNSKILDDHADPQLITPETALEFDSNSGQHIYKRHQALTLDKNGNKPEYLTWDGSLENSYKQIELIMSLFYMISRTNPQMYGIDVSGNLSGDALTKILLMPISATKEMVLAEEEAAEKALECFLALNNKQSKVNIEFEVGSFNSLEDISNRVQSELRSGASSIERAVKDLNPRYTDEEIVKEVEAIKADKDTVSNMADLVDPNTGQVV